ncbi:MAG: hypothetical protein ACOCV8_00710 [Spirochaetota bacterium]
MKILVFNGALGVKHLLELVLSSAKENNVDKIICLGDLIGIGKENLECINIARKNEIQLIGGTFEAILTEQLNKREIDESILEIINNIKTNIAKQDLLWLSDLTRLTILENLLFMYGNYINRYTLFTRENEFTETDLITRKKHPMLDGIIIGSANQQNFYNGKRLIKVRTQREYSYKDIDNAKFMATPGRLFSMLRGGIIKSTWIIIDTENKTVDFNTKKNQLENELDNINYYDLESVFNA